MQSSENVSNGAADETSWMRVGRLAVAVDLLLAATLAIFLTVATESRGDAIPRPLAIGVLFAVPGVIGLLGVIGRRRSLLAGAGLPLLPGSLLSFALLTLVFVLPAILFAAAIRSMPPGPRLIRDRLIGLGQAVLLAGLVICAAFAVLIGMTVEGCNTIPGGYSCSSAQISWSGVLTAVVLLLTALGIAALTVRAELRLLLRS